jgi:hypothetical protein
VFLGVKTPPGLFGGVRAGDKAHGRGNRAGFLQAAWRLAVSLPGAKCPGNMAKHGQNRPRRPAGRPAGRPRPAARRLQASRQGGLACCQAAWQAALGVLRPVSRAFLPPKVGLKGLGEYSRATPGEEEPLSEHFLGMRGSLATPLWCRVAGPFRRPNPRSAEAHDSFDW